MAQELFDLGDGLAVSSNPGGRFHGWLFRKHPDGQYVSVRKLSVVADPFGPLADIFLHVTPKADACDHDFGGWRELPDGNGGEQFCSKCGMGAMAHSLRTGDQPMPTRPAYSAQEYERLISDIKNGVVRVVVGSSTGNVSVNVNSRAMIDTAIRIASMQDEIVEVLEPFANFIEGNAAKSLPDSFAVSAGSSMARQQLTAGDCRKARALLSKLTGSEPSPDKQSRQDGGEEKEG